LKKALNDVVSDCNLL